MAHVRFAVTPSRPEVSKISVGRPSRITCRHVYVYMYICICIYIYICISSVGHLLMCLPIDTRVCIRCISSVGHLLMCLPIDTRVCIRCKQLYVSRTSVVRPSYYIHRCLFIYLHNTCVMCRYIYIYIYIHTTYIYIYIYTHTHVYTCSIGRPSCCPA